MPRVMVELSSLERAAIPLTEPYLTRDWRQNTSMSENVERFLCITSYEKGQDFMRQLAELGVKPTLLTMEKLHDAPWPREILEEVVTMPAGLTNEQITNTVTWMARGRNFDRIAALDEFDMEIAAQLREHMRIPGVGTTAIAYYRDKLAMRMGAREAGFLVPEFVRVLNYDELRGYMDRVPAPWLLKPRSEASALGIKKIENPEQLWRALDELGDRQSYFLMEQFVPGEIFHVDSIISEGKVVFSSVHQYGRPPMQVMHEGGVFTTRTVDRQSREWAELTALNSRLAPALGLERGVTHGEYIGAHAHGRFYFLEIAARVGGAFIVDLVEHSTGVNLWREWAKIEVAHLRGERYTPPVAREDYAGSVLCLAKEEEPDTSAFNAPEIVHRMKKHHHAGLIVRSEKPERVAELLEEYSQAFVNQFLATMPAPDRPTA
jgi:biotin carboxylase